MLRGWATAIRGWAADLGLAAEDSPRQTDDEATLIGWLGEAVDTRTDVVLNPAAFTHYSYALRDASAQLTTTGLRLVEVHLTNPAARERFRHTSGGVLGWRPGPLAGFGADSYRLALQALASAPTRRRRRRRVTLRAAVFARTGRARTIRITPPTGRRTWRPPTTSRTAPCSRSTASCGPSIEFQHVKPGKGGAFVRTKIKNVLSGKAVDKTFNAGVKVETANVDRRDYQYLYMDGDDFVFMDTSDLRPDHRRRGEIVGARRTTCSRART